MRDIEVESHWEYSQIFVAFDETCCTQPLKVGGRLVFLSLEQAKALSAKLDAAICHYEQTEATALAHDIYADEDANCKRTLE